MIPAFDLSHLELFGHVFPTFGILSTIGIFTSYAFARHRGRAA
jgi:hypothetical protein